MIKLYKLVKNEHGVEIGVWKETPFHFIPFVQTNREYQEYLKWLSGYEFQNDQWVKTSNGNTPEPADE